MKIKSIEKPCLRCGKPWCRCNWVSSKCVRCGDEATVGFFCHRCRD